jgi:hypothetical protein
MSAVRLEKAVARRCGSGIPRTRKVVLTGASSARDPRRRRVKALSALPKTSCSSPAGPMMTCLAAAHSTIDRSATAAVLARSQIASITGAAALDSQQTGACGAGSAGSTKGMQSPRARAGCVAAHARELSPALQTAGALQTAPAQAVVTLIVWIAPEKFPGQLTLAQGQSVVVGTDVRRPGGTNIMSKALHGGTATTAHQIDVYV